MNLKSVPIIGHSGHCSGEVGKKRYPGVLSLRGFHDKFTLIILGW